MSRGIGRSPKGRKPKKAASCPADEETLGMVNQGLNYLAKELVMLMGLKLSDKARRQSEALMEENWKKVVSLVKKIDEIGRTMVSTSGLEVDPTELVKRGLEYLKKVLDTLTKSGQGNGEQVAGLVKAIQDLKKTVGGPSPPRPGLKARRTQRW